LDLESLLHPGLTSVDDNDLQSFQAPRKHSPLGIRQGRQIFWTSFAKNAGSKFNEVSMLVHGADGSIAVQVQFA